MIKNTVHIPFSNLPSICVAISYSKHSYNYEILTNKYYHIANFMMLHCTHPLLYINTHMQTTTRCYRKPNKNQTESKICIQKLFLPALLFS